MVRYLGPCLPPPLDADPSPSSYGQTDRARGWTLLADVPITWGPGDRLRVCRLCGEAPPCNLSMRLMVSLPVHVSCFDLNIVYTNMSGVSPSPPFSRLVLELYGEYFSSCCDRCPSDPSALLFVRRGPRWCSVPPTCKYPILCPLSQGTRTDFGAQSSVNDPIYLREWGAMVAMQLRCLLLLRETGTRQRRYFS